MKQLCVRCGRRERFANLLVCAACVETMIRSENTTGPVLRPFEPEWVKRSRMGGLPAKDWTRAA
jgi:hypothetical protein